MPPKSIRECLDGILGSLSQENFDRFVHKLVQRQQEPRVLLNKVEGKRDWEVVEVMIQTFTENTAVDVAMELLEEIDLTSEAEELGKLAQTCRYKPTSGPSDEKHFVDKHRMALIQRLSLLDPILDELLDEGVINSEMYSEIRLEKQTKQDKVRRLLDYLSKTGDKAKDVFLSALRDQQPDLFYSLEKGKLVESADRFRRDAEIKQRLMETLNPLSYMDFEKFKWWLQHITSHRISKRNVEEADTTQKLVDLMVKKLGWRSVEVTEEVFMYMNWKSQRNLSERSRGGKGKDPPLPLHQEADMVQKVLETLQHLKYEERRRFWLILEYRDSPSFPRFQRFQYERDTPSLVWLTVQRFGERTVEVVMDALKDIDRMDLVEKLSESISASKGALKKTLQAPESTADSSSWTKLEPEVNSTDAGEAPSYSLQSEAGRFECSVSGLRWVCKERSSFKYQFCSWDGHMERMESRHYVPAGPLIDLTVLTGKFNEVYLPHWVCIEDNPKILDEFAVLHIDDCGDVVEKVSEVTPSHVKLTEPIFSPRAVLMKAGVPVKYKCNVLIYQINTAFLTLHVYLIPRDPGLQQKMDLEKTSCGHKIISKPPPTRSLKMRERFILTASVEEAVIYPREAVKLKYPAGSPDFYEVYIENPDRNFNLELTPAKDTQSVWGCDIRREEYESYTQGSSGGATGFSSMADVATALSAAAGGNPEPEEEHFVDKHMVELIQRVSPVGPILDALLKAEVIHQETYNKIQRLDTSESQIRELYCGPLKAGKACKDIFYSVLLKTEPHLIADLNKGSR
ncbi:uncharacterized protein LOC121641650 isoform X2 [Melanotaenia boesemani]|uniref:uncharacterized protein LOC121641650 isoform X2 n=1 Tax=Melanotaenia boesemani TaxID=1250792 RepID=UPI001C03BE4D|nr:uncharacterized protein LOC121641650 isoform X2 [Melanotaenia boesemani]